MVYFRGGPTAQDETVLVRKQSMSQSWNSPLEIQSRSRRQSRLSRQHLFRHLCRGAVKPHAKRKSAKAVISEDQIPLFKIA